jgi:hypothetical protein
MPRIHCPPRRPGTAGKSPGTSTRVEQKPYWPGLEDEQSPIEKGLNEDEVAFTSSLSFDFEETAALTKGKDDDMDMSIQKQASTSTSASKITSKITSTSTPASKKKVKFAASTTFAAARVSVESSHRSRRKRTTAPAKQVADERQTHPSSSSSSSHNNNILATFISEQHNKQRKRKRELQAVNETPTESSWNDNIITSNGSSSINISTPQTTASISTVTPIEANHPANRSDLESNVQDLGIIESTGADTSKSSNISLGQEEVALSPALSPPYTVSNLTTTTVEERPIYNSLQIVLKQWPVLQQLVVGMHMSLTRLASSAAPPRKKQKTDEAVGFSTLDKQQQQQQQQLQNQQQQQTTIERLEAVCIRLEATENARRSDAHPPSPESIVEGKGNMELLEEQHKRALDDQQSLYSSKLEEAKNVADQRKSESLQKDKTIEEWKDRLESNKHNYQSRIEELVGSLKEKEESLQQKVLKIRLFEAENHQLRARVLTTAGSPNKKLDELSGVRRASLDSQAKLVKEGEDQLRAKTESFDEEMRRRTSDIERREKELTILQANKY